MKYLAIRELHEDQDYSINWMCRKLEISRAAYYKWLNRDIPVKELEDMKIAGKIEERHERYGGILGYRRMTIFLNREEGTDYKPKRIRRIMRITGIHSSIRRVRNCCTVSNKKDQKADNLLGRNFEASAPNEKWTTDVTEFKVPGGKGKIYLSAFMDLYDRSIVSWAVSGHNDNNLVIDTFREAIAANPVGRVREVRADIDFLMARREKLCSIIPLIESGELPLRVTHNDTKSNNVMLDADTGKALCVIDLDTVMPGSALYDYGDAIRFGGNAAAEDEADTAKISLDMEKTEAFTRGFIGETNGFLTENELCRLPLGIYVMTGELAVRFLWDYISGDHYWKTDLPDHNLRRSRAQAALLRDVERKEGELQAMVDRLIL